MALVVVAQAAQFMPILLFATALSGIANGIGYRGSLAVINDIAPDERRAEVVSPYYVACSREIRFRSSVLERCRR